MKKSYYTNENLAPADCISAMYDNTNEDGILFIPSWPYDDIEGDMFYRCQMNWNECDCDKTIRDLNIIFDNLRKIAELTKELDDCTEIENILSPELTDVWNTYIRGYEPEDFDRNAIIEISEKIDSGEEITDEEALLYHEYDDAIITECERRIGSSVCAFEVIYRAKRLYKLLCLEAPDVVVQHEARLLAESIVLHHYADTLDIVDGTF